MNEDRLIEMQATLARIEGKLDGFHTRFESHLIEDSAVAADVSMLVRRQRGFIGIVQAAGLAVGAAITWAVGKVIGGGNWK